MGEFSRSSSCYEGGGLIEHIYDAALDHTRWRGVLARLAEAVGAADVGVYATRPGEMTLSSAITGILPDAVNEIYLRSYAALDVQMHRLLELPQDAMISGDDLMDDLPELKCPVHNEFLVPHGISEQVVWYFPTPDGVRRTVAFMRGREKGPFSGDERRRISAIVPHIRKSFEISRHAAPDRESDAVLEALFARLDIGVLHIDRQRRLHHSNAAAHRILGGAHFLRLTRGGEIEPVGWHRGALARLLAAACEGEPGRMPVEDMAAGRRVVVETLPLAFLHGGHGGYLLLLIDGSAAVGVSAGILSKLMTVTFAEAELAMALASGDTLGSYAGRKRLSIHTVRNQLKSIYSKTGLGTQKDLVATVCAFNRY